MPPPWSSTPRLAAAMLGHVRPRGVSACPRFARVGIAMPFHATAMRRVGLACHAVAVSDSGMPGVASACCVQPWSAGAPHFHAPGSLGLPAHVGACRCVAMRCRACGMSRAGLRRSAVVEFRDACLCCAVASWCAEVRCPGFQCSALPLLRVFLRCLSMPCAATATRRAAFRGRSGAKPCEAMPQQGAAVLGTALPRSRGFPLELGDFRREAAVAGVAELHEPAPLSLAEQLDEHVVGVDLRRLLPA